MNPTHLIITNRTALGYAEGELPKRIHIVPRGELPNREAGIVQVLDDAAIDSIFADLTANKATRGGLYLGEEHFIYNDEKSSEAFAWAKRFEKDAQGIWAIEPEWSDVGGTAIRNKRFKWTSFVADRKDTQPLDGKRVRILKIDTVGFTNQANGKELLTPVCNRNDFAGPAGAGSAVNQTTKTKGTMKTIATKLGLAAEASEEAILDAVTKLQNRAQSAEAEAAPLKNRVTALETETQTLLGEQIEADFAAAGIKDEKIVNRHKPLLSDAKHFANRAARLEFIKDLAPKSNAPAVRVLNRADTRSAEATPSTAPEKAVADKILNRARALQKDGLKFEAAYEQATRDVLTESAN